MFVWTYPDLYRDRRRRVRLRLNLNLNLDLNLAPNLNLDLFLFQKSFEEPNPTLFHQLYGLKYRSLYDSVNLAPYRKT